MKKKPQVIRLLLGEDEVFTLSTGLTISAISMLMTFPPRVTAEAHFSLSVLCLASFFSLIAFSISRFL